MNSEAFKQLTSEVGGSVITAEDPGYEEARRLWNGTVSKRPAVIVKCKNTDDVISAVNFARDNGLHVSVRGGGHHVAGAAILDGGLVVDLSEMRAVQVDTANKSVRAEGGALLKDVDSATLPEGLAAPMGLFSETGIAGLTLSGGYGWLRRLYGLSCDNLLSAQVVTADGELVTVSAAENEDLFWALRGGGTDLGVVTSFEYRAYPIPPELFLLFVTYPMSEAKQVLARFNEYMKTAPREVNALAVIWTFPAAEPYPEEIWNQAFVGIAGPYIGPPEEGQQAYQPLRELGTVMFDASDVMPFGVIQTLFDEDYPKGRRYYWKSTYLEELDEAGLDKLIERGLLRPSPLTSLDLWSLGGAIDEVGTADSALGQRGASYLIGIESNWEDPADDAANIEWARETEKELAPFSTGSSYLNFEDLSEAGRVAQAHGANYDRLVEIKQKYDPKNLFRSRRGLVD
jgi:FAD/FMN-containing dehydrogenase